MLDSKPYRRKFTGASTWVAKAIGLVVAGAATVIVAMTIAKSVSTKPDHLPDGKFVGVRHDAAPISTAANIKTNVPVADSGQTAAPAPDTVVQNGVTVVSPQLLVPVVDIDELRTATGQTDASSSKSSSARKPRRYASRSRSYHHPRWTAYGLALR